MERCEACNGKGYLEVVIDENYNVENQWCENCWIILPDYDPPEIKE